MDIWESIRRSEQLNEKMLSPFKAPDRETISIPTPDFRNYHLADYQFEVLKETIQEFEAKLDDNHEVAVKLASFGQTVLMHVTDLGFSNPVLIHFYGYVNGQRAELIQHVGQLNFLLTAVPIEEPNRPARRIGFHSDET